MIICFMHDNPLLPLFKDPYKMLRKAGLKPQQKVLEVGCGPGYFTIPASRIVGDGGMVYAVDVQPLAIKRVERKVKAQGITNVRPILKNASETGLPERSIDLAFVFGLPYVIGGREALLFEMNRLLKPRGTLSYRKSRGSEKKLIGAVESSGLLYSGKKGRILIFEKKG